MTAERWESCLYVGRVRHRRLGDPSHTFRQRLFMVYLDLDEIPHLFRGRWFWSAGRPNLAWFRRADHWGPPEQPLADSIRDLVHRHMQVRPRGPIRLLTHLRYGGVQMNPISLYYCHEADGRLAAVVAEVHNTPWGERHCYVLPAEGAKRTLRAEAEKQLHVSPFLDMNRVYEFRLSRPADHLVAQVRCRSRAADSSGGFDATLSLQRRNLEGPQLIRVLCRYPWMTAQVYVGIYWQAFRLWRKGAAFFPHPGSSATGASLGSHAAGMPGGPS